MSLKHVQFSIIYWVWDRQRVAIVMMMSKSYISLHWKSSPVVWTIIQDDLSCSAHVHKLLLVWIFGRLHQNTSVWDLSLWCNLAGWLRGYVNSWLNSYDVVSFAQLITFNCMFYSTWNNVQQSKLLWWKPAFWFRHAFSSHNTLGYLPWFARKLLI